MGQYCFGNALPPPALTPRPAATMSAATLISPPHAVRSQPERSSCTAAIVVLLPQPFPRILHNNQSLGTTAYYLGIVVGQTTNRPSQAIKKPSARLQRAGPAITPEAMLSALPHPM